MDTAFIDLKREAIPGEDDHSARRHKLCQELNGFIEVTEGVSIVSDPQYEGGDPHVRSTKDGWSMRGTHSEGSGELWMLEGLLCL